ncbi:MAG TPA: winged helix-turn-helix transcriptional regulator [Candidatus Woesearchaeota archaeon]|nr:winged helix-turn-helix transcriptional regulator [Candidatus Woesearchaeota archaeon]
MEKTKSLYILSTHRLIVINKMKTAEKIMAMLLREGRKTATEIAERLRMSRQAAWKTLKSLIQQRLVLATALNSKQTSAQLFTLNFRNPVAEKALSLSLTRQAVEHERWLDLFSGIEGHAEFFLLFGSILKNPKKANDIDVIAVAEKKEFAIIQEKIQQIQLAQAKRIHAALTTKTEFSQEIKEENKAYLEAISKGVVLFGQEKFINAMRELNER